MKYRFCSLVFLSLLLEAADVERFAGRLLGCAGIAVAQMSLSQEIFWGVCCFVLVFFSVSIFFSKFA